MGERVVYCVAASYLRPFAACHGTVDVSRHKLVECVVATRRAERSASTWDGLGGTMAFKLTKAETLTRDKLAADLRLAHEQVERTIRAYNDALRAARDFAEQRAAAWREQHDGRSERWQRSNTGSVVDAFIDEWEDYQPDDAEPPEPDAIDEFEALPNARGG